MKELTDEQKPSPIIWWWLLVTICAVIGVVVLSERDVLPTWAVWRRVAAVFGVTMLWGTISRILTEGNGVRRMFTVYWLLGIRGYDRVWFRLPNEMMMDDRIEPSWMRNALLNCQAGKTPERHTIYHRLSGWRRAFRIGKFDGTPHIVWRNDLKLSPNYGEKGYLDSLDMSDRHGLCIRFQLDEMLTFLNVVAVPSLYLGIANLLNEHGTQRIMLKKSAETIKALEQEIAGHQQERNNLQQRLEVSAGYAANLFTVANATIMTFGVIKSEMTKGTRFQHSKEGQAVQNALMHAVRGIIEMRGKASAVKDLKLPTEGEVYDICYPKG